MTISTEAVPKSVPLRLKTPHRAEPVPTSTPRLHGTELLIVAFALACFRNIGQLRKGRDRGVNERIPSNTEDKTRIWLAAALTPIISQPDEATQKDRFPEKSDTSLLVVGTSNTISPSRNPSRNPIVAL